MIILYTSENVASKNIAEKLVAEHGFARNDGSGTARQGMEEWVCGDIRLIDTKAPSVLEVPADFDTDYVIVLSTHRSKIPEKIMTAHIPGNWGNADMGGSPRTLVPSPASRLKILMQEIKREADRIGWKSSLEADHHGPTGSTPMIFAEIGSGEAEWADNGAASAMARAIMASVRRDERFQTVLGIGGGHYPRLFTRLVLEGDVAVSHIAPKYVIDQIDEGMFRQAVQRSVEKVSKVVVAKDETNAGQKSRVSGFAERAGIPCEFI